MAKTFKICDTSNLVNSKRYYNQAGFLVLPDCKIACSGVLQYSQVKGQDGELIAGGDLINVYRSANALKECCQQFANLPLSLNHPEKDEVTPENAKGVTVGALGSEPRYEEKDGIGYIICDIIVYDSEAQKQIENDQFKELSAGYSTAFRSCRGTVNGESYEAEQFLLEPNHVALVAEGRCGSECRVCDTKENPIKQKGDLNMIKKVKAKDSSCRYFLSIGDSEDDVVELTKEQAGSIMKKNPDVEVEELDEEEVEFEDTESLRDVRGVNDEDDKDGEKKEPAKVDEEIKKEEKMEKEVEKADQEVEKEAEMTFEVQFEDGTVGKMDKVAYEHTRRFLEVEKKGDSMSKDASFTTGLILTGRAAEVLGSNFSIEKYAKGDCLDGEKIKGEIIQKVYPNVVVRSLRGDALEQLYQSAYKTFKESRQRYDEDLLNLNSIPQSVADSSAASMVDNARKKYFDRLHGVK